jgi:hypothetical protein
MDMEKYFDHKPIEGAVQRAIAEETAKALMHFCGQEPEFQQAVEQSDKTFQQCLDAVAKGVGGSISDLKAYQKAADFYFPGCKVHFWMSIDLIGDAGETEPLKKPEITMSKKNNLSLSLDDLLDF